jgi:hypothetical protein
VVNSIETTRRIIEIRKEQYGYSTSATSRDTSPPSEITYCLDLKEAEEELKRYVREDEPRAIPPPAMQKKLESIDDEPDDESVMIDFGATLTHKIECWKMYDDSFEVRAYLCTNPIHIPLIHYADTYDDALSIFNRIYRE